MADVAIGSQMRANLLSLQRTNKQMDTTQFNLSTGRKINSALDGAQAFFTSQTLNHRANDLNRLLDSMGQAIQTIKEADKGVTALTTLIEQADAIATEAQDELAGSDVATLVGDRDLTKVSTLGDLAGIAQGANDTFSLDIGGTSATIDIDATGTVQDLADNINQNATLKGLVEAEVTDGGALQIKATNKGDYVRIEQGGGAQVGALGFVSLGLSDYVTSEDVRSANGGTANNTGQGGTVMNGHTLTSAAANANTVASDLLDGSGLMTITDNVGTDDNVTGTVTLTLDGTTTIDVDVDETTTIQGFIDGINNHAQNTGGKVTASYDETTLKISLELDDSVEQVKVANSFKTGTDAADQIAFSMGFGAGQADATVIQNDATAVQSEVITFAGGVADPGRLQSDFNEIRSQIDSLVKDAGYRGINLLEGDDLTTYFNEDRTSTLVTKGADFTAAGLGVNAADFTTENGVAASIGELRQAMLSVRDFGATIGTNLTVIQTRESFTEDTVQVLQEGSDKLTLADPNEEGAKMLALQTRLQLGVTSMSLASQSEQSVLSMFG